jgi:hypothetical protein
VARNHTDQEVRTREARAGKPHAKPFSGEPAAKKTRPAQNPVPEFVLVGDAYGEPTTIGDLLRFAHVEPVGRNRWYVEARPLEWVLLPGHAVWLTPGGLIQCDCRQAVAGRECDHALAVRHLGTVKPARPADPRQMRLVPDAEPTVRAKTPARRFRNECRVKPRVVTMRGLQTLGGGRS